MAGEQGRGRGAVLFFSTFDQIAAKVLLDDAAPQPGLRAFPPSAPGSLAHPQPTTPSPAVASPAPAEAPSRPRSEPKPVPPSVDGEDPFKPKMPPLPTRQPPTA